MSGQQSHANKVSLAGLLVTLGIVYGDIGTSPLYVLKALVGESIITQDLVLGGISCVIWTLTLQTTFKYVILTLRADNNGEGGILSLYALVRKRSKILVFPAIIGACALLADGIITPPISVTSAIEQLSLLNSEIPTVPIVTGIILALFLVQQFGTERIGIMFGPIMFIWFLMLAVLGVSKIPGHTEVLMAVNPYYAINFITNVPNGFWLLGAVFLCTTGAEALYSDLGHCGRNNVRMSWIFVKICLILNYFGQGAWLLSKVGQQTNDGTGPMLDLNPFFEIMPNWFMYLGIAIAATAAIIASQALISGAFTLISEAIRLNIWPKFKIKYPSNVKGQLYIPAINWMLLTGCLVVVWYFRESANMEAAYGLSITITMLMTTWLLTYYLISRNVSRKIVIPITLIFLSLEASFLIANLSKFTHGGWVTLLVGGLLFTVMWTWLKSRKIKDRLTEFVDLEPHLGTLRELSNDKSVNKYATHLVYMTASNDPSKIESKVLYSIINKRPKRADIYWFIHVDTLDDPHTTEYQVKTILQEDIIWINFRLGFRIEPRINLLLRYVIEDMVKNKEVNITSRYESLNRNNITGDFRFVVLEKYLSNENDLPFFESLVMQLYFLIKEYSLPEDKAFGLDTSSVKVEKVPLIISAAKKIQLTRISY
ncbi:MAG: KUP/HAK/KT family potassium transporter [Bacteroidia bacterium]|nr:KUP/HAK/KT family potassium transporter [Bacteroidia bacterium]